MRVMEVISFIREGTNDSYYRYFPNKFPRDDISAEIPNECATVTVLPGGAEDEWTGKKEPSFQILVRGDIAKDSAAEAKAYEIFDFIKNKKDVNIGADSVSIIRPVGSAPFYIGDDDNYRPIYSMNFNVVIKPSSPN